MERTADAVVIGGGILGASTAHFLAKQGVGKVVLLEKRTLAAVETGHSAAVVRAFYSNPLTIRLAVRATEMFENAADMLGGSCDFRAVGYLVILHASTEPAARRVLGIQREMGSTIEELTPQDIADIAPELNLDGLVAGLFEPRSGYANPIKATKNLVERAKQWGLVAFEGLGATGIILDGDRIAGVETDQGTVSTPVVVNAGGPWGREVGCWLGLNVSLRWSRESELIMRLPAGFAHFPVITCPEERFYFRPDGTDQILCGLGYPKEIEPIDINAYDSRLDDKTRDRISGKLFKRLPKARFGTQVDGWTSMYTITDDWHPLVGPDPERSGYYACFGGSGHCFKLGPPIGEALADVICGKQPAIDIHGLRPTRFIEGEAFSSTWGSGNRA